jgi:ATP-dependent exoDNAse (exonuclease V) beta subunit
MTERPTDQEARDRFTGDWATNLAVAANAGSGKTTAISERLAAMAASEAGAEMLGRTAVVTYTNKAAAQIGQKARSVLLRRIADADGRGAEALARLDRAFFGTIHSFCILLARRHGSTLGIHLNPTLVEEGGEESYWEEFLEQDPMTFGSLGAGQVSHFLRHASLDVIFELARDLDAATARDLAARSPSAAPPPPPEASLQAVLSAVARKGPGAAALKRNQETAVSWMRRFTESAERLPVAVPEGGAANIAELYRAFFAPLKEWLAQAGGVMAAELSLRYRAWRVERGIQTYDDQVESALSVLEDKDMLESIRAEGWRIILDEAQDTDAKQFSVLVEIARPPGAKPGTWPVGSGPPPRPGHFCMVGDAQQGIYSKRADIRNFTAHVEAFSRGGGCERLTFDVTFRVPERVVRLLNGTLAGAFGTARDFNLGVDLPDGAPAQSLQVAYERLAPGPGNAVGNAWRLPTILGNVPGTRKVGDLMLAEEARQIAAILFAGGPASVGAANWGDICILAPRRGWLSVVRDEFGKHGLKTALQLRRTRNGDIPVYAWLCGLLAVICDPENSFEWVGVLREIFSVSDADIAAAVRDGAGLQWDEPENYSETIRSALAVLAPFIGRVDDEGDTLEVFARELARACGLEGKAHAVDPEGALGEELERLLAAAAELGIGGGGPRSWFRALLDSHNEDRAWGRPAPDSINLITSHSAKGLEWPVVIPVGLWREIGSHDPRGLRLVRERGGAFRVVLDNDGISSAMRESAERELLREHVRLLYVTLTRAQRALVVPWPGDLGPEDRSFGALWALDPVELDPLPEPRTPAEVEATREPAPRTAPIRRGLGETPARMPDLPRRILPHALAGSQDLARAALHESALDQVFPAKDAPDPLEYGVWWHKTLEFLPWTSDEAEVRAHGALSMAEADNRGFGERGRGEWERLLASEPWKLMRDARWTRLAEVGVFAPLATDSWIDGVIDLVLRDPAADELWIVDWKTNRRNPSEDDSALLARLSSEYARQLAAYGACASGFFQGSAVSLWVYSTVAGAWTRVENTR